MKRNVTNSTGEKLLQMNVLLDNVQEEELKTAMSLFGYDDARLNEGKVLYNVALAALEKQKAAHTAQVQATSALNTAKKSGKRKYSNLVKIARRAIAGNVGAIKEVGIYGKQPLKFELWLKSARAFFTTALANEALMSEFIVFGVTEAVLQEGLTMIAELEALFADRSNLLGLNQVATFEKNQHIKAMNTWYWDCIQMARIAFENSPQHLERFNITKYSPSYKPKKTEPSDDNTTTVLNTIPYSDEVE